MHRDDDARGLTPEERALATELEDLWRAAEPPGHFADRVVAGWAEEQGARDASPPVARTAHGWRWSLIPLAAAAALALVVGAQQLGLGWPSRGEALVDGRSTLTIGRRAVVVAEPGASLSWQVDERGQATVQQHQGDAFYRVESGGRFEVQTPAGQVTVHGTCFRVALDHARVAPDTTERPVAVRVTVYEGEVELRSTGEPLRLHAGEAALASLQSAPRRLEEGDRELPRADPRGAGAQRELLTQLQSVEAQLSALPAQQPAQIASELKAVREELSRVRRELASEQEQRLAVEGATHPFPEDLDARYLEPELQRAFSEALARSRVAGQIAAIDCTEYPCIVYGEIQASRGPGAFDEALRSLTEQLKLAYPDATNALRVWAAQKRGDDGAAAGDGSDTSLRNLFGISILPTEEGRPKQPDEALARRLMFRNSQYLEATLGP